MNSANKQSVVLLDLDGVVRHFDPDHVAEVERCHGLRAGLLLEAAFTPSVLMPAITGQATRAEWTAHVGELVDNLAAAQEWMAERGTVDQQILSLVDDLRTDGVIVAILTNGTSTIDDEMHELQVAPHFDAIFNSFDIGYAKPDPRAFEHVCAKLAVEPHQVFFTDDSPGKLTGARELGMAVAHFVSIETLRGDLNAFGVLDQQAIEN